jgi:hypothetical protein
MPLQGMGRDFEILTDYHIYIVEDKMGKYINCDSDIKPTKKGFYSIHVSNERSSLPEYLEFDNKSWIGLEKMQQENEEGKFFWNEDEKPLQERPVFNNPFVNSNK